MFTAFNKKTYLSFLIVPRTHEIVELLCGWWQDREEIQLSFCAGKIKVVVATVAFGMGVDAQGVKGVVHLTLPRSLEEYVQQVLLT